MSESKSESSQLPRNVLIPGFALLCILWIDHKTPGITVTPLFAGVAILILAFSLRPKWMIFWAIAYTGAVLAVLLLPVWGVLIGWSSPPVNIATQYIRAFTFLATAALGVSFSLILSRQRRMATEFRILLEGMAVPILTSDRNGVILFMNKSMERLLQIESGLAEVSYFDLLAPHGRQGETIATYLGKFSVNGNSPHQSLAVEIRGKSYLARTSLMESISPPVMITMIHDAANGERSTPSAQ